MYLCPLEGEISYETSNTFCADKGRKLAMELQKFDEIATVVNKSKGKNSPLFLEFVAQIFFLLTAREFNNLNYNEVIQVAVRHVDNMSSKKISDAAVYILKEAANIIFEKPEKAIAATRLLAISPHGLRRSDLESILKLHRVPQ